MGEAREIRPQRIKQNYRRRLAPVALEVIDDSHKHAGHAHAMRTARQDGRDGRDPLSR